MTSQEALIDSINQKIFAWKTYLGRMTGQDIADPSGVSFIDILKQSNKELSLHDLTAMVMAGVVTVGRFDQNQLSILNSPEKMEAKGIANYIFSGEIDFAATEEAGAIIALPPAFQDQRFAITLHSQPVPMLEILYETKDELLPKISDHFVCDQQGFYTIKPVENLESDPVLKARIQELNL